MKIGVHLSELWPVLGLDGDEVEAPDELVNALMDARLHEREAEVALCTWIVENVDPASDEVRKARRLLAEDGTYT